MHVSSSACRRRAAASWVTSRRRLPSTTRCATSSRPWCVRQCVCCQACRRAPVCCQLAAEACAWAVCVRQSQITSLLPWSWSRLRALDPLSARRPCLRRGGNASAAMRPHARLTWHAWLTWLTWHAILSASLQSTVCVGSAFGEAAMLLAAGEPGRRAALPSTSIMIRQPMQRYTQMQVCRVGGGGGGTLSVVAKWRGALLWCTAARPWRSRHAAGAACHGALWAESCRQPALGVCALLLACCCSPMAN